MAMLGRKLFFGPWHGGRIRGEKKEPDKVRLFIKGLAATYSRGGYTTTTIGNAAFDGRVRDGIGSGRSFVATKKIQKEHLEYKLPENYTQRALCYN